MNESEAAEALAQSLASIPLNPSALLMLGGQIMTGILIGSGIIAVAILVHAIIHGLMVRTAIKTKTN